ncbi:MAG: hypothetical protein H6727_07330 [Myxococcales bacterium]|nr:hypothetical protein [Myxococcales bacterium]
MYWIRKSPQDPSQRRILLRSFGLLFLGLGLLPACFITAAPETRGWRCESSTECTPGLICVEGICRGSCGDKEDCQVARNEECIEKTTKEDIVAQVCMPPCREGEERECFTGPEGRGSTGICKVGKQRCDASQIWGPCLGQILPATEICNQKDDDCDGQVDNGVNCACNPGDTRACFSALPGFRNRGACKDGIETCGASGQWAGQCKGEVVPSNEVCNGKDDDCDGQVDDAVSDVGKECNVPGKSGPCQKGITECVSGKLQCKQTVQPKVEDCNGVDDDCDGKIDNNPLGEDYTLTRSCYSGAAGCVLNTQTNSYDCKGICRGGAQRCSKDLKSWEAGCLNEIKPTPDANGVDSCNGKDDDCDGKFDESDNRVGNACNTPLSGACRAGKQVCDQGQLVCKSTQNKPETCNNLDDDCDGKVDNGATCSGGLQCVNGTCQ